MSRVRRKNVRSDKKRTKKEIEEESKFRWCPIRKLRFAKVICEEVCTNKKCPIVREKLEKKRKDAIKRKKRKIKKEQKKLEEQGVTRNLLLRPEDRNGSNN